MDTLNQTWAIGQDLDDDKRTIPAEKPTANKINKPMPQQEQFLNGPFHTDDYEYDEETNYADPYLLSRVIGQRDTYKAHADKLAEALRGLLSLDIGPCDTAREALAAYEEARQ